MCILNRNKDPKQPFYPAGEDRPDCAMFLFDGPNPGTPGTYPSISSSELRRFEEAFYLQIRSVKEWFIEREWISERAELLCLPASTTYRPDKSFQVLISAEYKLSRALVPAWSAQRGRMEFPAFRVVAAEAAIAHELAHVFFPNANRLLAEGLAVYVQQCVGCNPGFPNFGTDLHRFVAQQLIMGRAGPFNDKSDLDKVTFVNLDKVPTPDHLAFRVGGFDSDDSSITYPLAGSFIQFLIEDFEPKGDRRCPKFFELYGQTPLVPLVRDAGSIDRWRRVYRHPLTDIEAEWRKLIADLL